MKLNKTKTFIIIWIIFIYIYYSAFILLYRYSNETLKIINVDDFLFFLLIPSFVFFPFVDGYLIIFIPIFLMYYLIWHKKTKIFKSFLLSVFFYFLFVNIIYAIGSDWSKIINRAWTYLICLSITILIIWSLFKKTFKRLNKENNLK